MAGKFTDGKGREWLLTLSAPLCKSIKQRLGISLTDLRSEAFNQLSTDPILLVDTLWLICEKQAAERGLSDVDFGESLVECIDDAVVALEVAIIDLFPTAKRSLLRSLQAKNQEMIQNASLAAMKDLEANQQQIEAAMAKRTRQEMLRLLEATDS